jgi:hypothetical protein
MPIPVIPASDAVQYVFQFSDVSAALRDPVVGALPLQEVLIFFPSEGPPPTPDYAREPQPLERPVLDLEANKPHSGVPLMPQKRRSWME